MNKLFQSILKLLLFFGIVAGVITIAHSIIASSSLFNSDDGYITGWAVSCFLLPGIILYLIFNNRHFFGVSGLQSYIGYYVLICCYFIYVMCTAELHGPALALLLLTLVGLFSLISLKLFKWLDIRNVRYVSIVITALYFFGFAKVWFR